MQVDGRKPMMRLNVLIPPMAALFMAAPPRANKLAQKPAPKPASVSQRFTIAARQAHGKLLPGSVQLLRNESIATREVLVSVSVTSGAAALLHNGSRVGMCRDGLFNTFLTIEPDDTVELRMDLAQGDAQGSYAIKVV
jgi:hypothetical protein